MSTKWNYNIIIAEDDISMRKLMQLYLGAQKGLNLHFFKDGLEALQFLEQCSIADYPVDLILSDWNMPKLSGLEFLNTVQRDFSRNIPFVMISGNSHSEEIKEAVIDGVTDYLIKPIDPQMLVKKILKILNCSELRTPNAKLVQIIERLEKTYKIDHKVIDSQHQQIINFIRSLIQESLNRDEIISVLTELAKYTQTHFKYEEDIMKKKNFEFYDVHKKLHTYFYNQIVEMSRMYRKTDTGKLNKDLLIFLLGWFKDHILKEDMKYKIIL